MFPGKIERIIDFSCFPEVVKQHGQLPGDANHGPLFGVLPSPFSKFQSPATQITVWSEGTEDVLSGTDQQAAQVGVSRFCNSQLRVLIAGLVTFWHETECRAYLAAFLEAARLFEGEDEAQGSEWAYAADFSEQFCFRVLILAELFNLSVVFTDLLGEGSDGVEDGEKSRLQGFWNIEPDFVSEAVCGARGQT